MLASPSGGASFFLGGGMVGCLDAAATDLTQS